MDAETPAAAGTPKPSRRRSIMRRILIIIGIVLVAVIAKPAWFLWNISKTDIADRPALPAGMIDDASALNATAIHEIWPVPKDAAEAERQLTELLARAKDERLKVSIAGARHSMGGHSIAPGGIVIDMRPFRGLELDQTTGILTAGSGAIWHDVLAYLDPLGRSVQVMQSNDSFTVGGSISVNCHGWQCGRPPIASTVESFRLMQADGSIVVCSRDENSELFSLVLGGYGLFGIILDARLKVTNNVRYRVIRHVVPAAEAMTTYPDCYWDEDSDMFAEPAGPPLIGWGAGFFDFDRDGDEDLAVFNGHVQPQVDGEKDGEHAYAQRPLLYRCDGRRQFAEVAGDAGDDFFRPRCARGAAFADYDEDGDVDIALSVIDGKLELLRNDTKASGHWLRVAVQGSRCNRDGYGARVTIEAGGRRATRWVLGQGSYVSQNDARAHFGLGAATRVDRVVVRWPGGIEEVAPGPFECDKTLLVREGEGVVGEAPRGAPVLFKAVSERR